MDCAFVRQDDATIVCGHCQRPYRWPSDRRGLPRRNCGVRVLTSAPSNRRLTLKGKILSCLPPPGDAAATLTKYTGLAALAEAWERISSQPCGCADRQAWMNAAWQRFVWQHFSAPADP